MQTDTSNSEISWLLSSHLIHESHVAEAILAEHGIVVLVKQNQELDPSGDGFELRHDLYCHTQQYDLAFDILEQNGFKPILEIDIDESLAQVIAHMDAEELELTASDEDDLELASMAEDELKRRGVSINNKDRAAWRARARSTVPEERHSFPELMFAILLSLVIPPMGFVFGFMYLSKAHAKDGSLHRPVDLYVQRVGFLALFLAIVGTSAIIVITAIGL